jgi:predicted permease
VTSGRLRQVVRALAAQPGLSLVVIVTLALGIGANSAVFSVVSATLLRPLPYPEPQRLVHLFEASEHSSRMAVSAPNFRDWHERSRSFEAMAGYAGGTETVLGGTEPVRARTWMVSRDFFDVFAVAPRLGRTFVAEESALGGTPAAVVSHGFWQRVLGGATDLPALRLRIGTFSCRVVGVMPAGFAYPAGADVWIPLELEKDDSGRTGHNLRVVARLRASASIDRARAEMDAIAARLQQEHPGDNDARRVTVVDLREVLVGGTRKMLWLLQCVVGLVLLAACANVASGLLTRGVARRKELAIRAAIGASRPALVLQLLTESLALALAGSMTGLVLAAWLLRTFRSLAPAGLPRVDEAGIDAVVAGFALVLSILATLVFGLVPALMATRSDLRDVLSAGGRLSAAPDRARLRDLLVSVEIALALVLLVGTGLLARSLARLVDVDPGFDPRGVMTADVTVPGVHYPDETRSAAFYRDLLEHVARQPGVRSVGLTSALPLGEYDPSGGLEIEGLRVDTGGDWQKGPVASYRLVGGDFFATLGIPVLRGRAFRISDEAGAPPVAIVNQAMAQRYWPGSDPIGRRLRFLGMDRDNPWLTIVGIVGNVRHEGIDAPAVPAVYVHYLQLPFRTRWTTTVVARASGEGATGALAGVLRRAIRSRDANVPVQFSTLEERVGASLDHRRFLLALVAGFTTIALVLAIVGVYGVVAHAVAQRTPEIGVRVALGADPRSVLALVARGALPAVAGGLGAGLVAALVAAQAVGSFLFELTPTDPLTLGSVLALLAAVAVLAALLPARRAVRIDVVSALQGP